MSLSRITRRAFLSSAIAAVAARPSDLAGLGNDPQPVKRSSPTNGGAFHARRGVRQSVPADAVHAALRDASAIPHALRPYFRWVWCRDAQLESFKAVAYVLNLVSRSPDLFNPLAGGILVRVDLRDMARNAADLAELTDLWESFQFDPFFSLLITGDSLRLLSAEQKQAIPITRRWKEWPKLPNGSWGEPELKTEIVRLVDLDAKSIVVERTTPEHLLRSGIQMLQDATGSLAPVVSDTYFVGRITSTLKDRTVVNGKERENLFSTLYGGLYYEFAGIRKSKVKGRSDFDQFLLDQSVNVPGRSFQEVFDQLPAAQRLAMERSKVTGKPRRVVWLPTLGARPTESESICFVTVDVENADVDVTGHALLNLGNGLVAKAFEVMAIRPNGHIGYALFDGQGKLLDFADGNKVVSDSTVPAPYTRTLQGAVSCVRCHGPHGAWQPLVNDVLTASKKIDIFGSRLGTDQLAEVQKLRQQYRGDFAGLLARLRRFQQRTTLLSTGMWPASKDQTDLVELTAGRVAQLFAKDRFDMVTPGVALAELGEPPVTVDAKAPATLKAVGFVATSPDGNHWIKDGDASFSFTTQSALETVRVDELLRPPPVPPGTFVFHDVRLALLQEGRPLLRNSWSLVYSFAMQRAAENRRAMEAAAGRLRGVPR